MRKTLFLTVVLLAVTAWAVAQQSPDASATPNAGQAAGQQNPGQTPGQSTMANPDAEQQQAPNAAPGAAQPSASPSEAGQSVEGCLGGSAGHFTVTDDAGTTYQLQIPAAADTSALNQHIGDKVRVTGKLATGDASAAASGASAGGKSIQVRGIDKLPGTCGAQGAGAASPKGH